MSKVRLIVKVYVDREDMEQGWGSKNYDETMKEIKDALSALKGVVDYIVVTDERDENW